MFRDTWEDYPLYEVTIRAKCSATCPEAAIAWAESVSIGLGDTTVSVVSVPRKLIIEAKVEMQ